MLKKMSFPVENETDEGSSAAKAISLAETCESDEVCSLISNANQPNVMNTEDNSNSIDLRVNQNQTASSLQQLIVQNQATLQNHVSDEENDNETDGMVDSHPVVNQDVNKAYFVVINDQNQEVNEDEGQNFILNEKSQLDGGAEMDIEKLQRMNSGFDNNEDIANSSFGEENILEHLSRQVTLQHQFLCNALSVNNDNASIDRIYEETSNSSLTSQQMTSATTTPVTSCVNNVVSISDQYAILPSLLHQADVQNSCFMTTSQNGIYPHQPISDEEHLHDATEASGNPNQDPERHSGTPVDPQRFVTLPNGSGRYIYTPHPKTGQLLYVSCEDSSPQLFHRLPPGSAVTTPIRVDTSSQFVTPKIARITPGQMPDGITRLNSSGEDTNSPDCPSDVSPTRYGSPTDSSDDKCTKFTSIDLTQALFCGGGGGEESREQHNMKERRRRARVKDACDVMRKLVPGMSDKTDKATVFEFAARYIHYLKGFSGTRHDKDFLLKYSPY